MVLVPWHLNHFATLLEDATVTKQLFLWTVYCKMKVRNSLEELILPYFLFSLSNGQPDNYHSMNISEVLNKIKWENMLINPPTPNFTKFPLSQEQESFAISPEKGHRQAFCVLIFILKSADRNVLSGVCIPPVQNSNTLPRDWCPYKYVTFKETSAWKNGWFNEGTPRKTGLTPGVLILQWIKHKLLLSLLNYP